MAKGKSSAGAEGFLVMPVERARALDLPFATILGSEELYNAYPDDDIDTEKVLSTFRTARDRGIGIVEVRASGKCIIQQNAIDLSLAALHRTDPKYRLKLWAQANSHRGIY